MDIFARKHLVAWLIGALVVVNLATLGALWLKFGRNPTPPPRGENRRSEARPGETRPDDVRRFLERELGLTPDQAGRLEELRRRHASEIQALQSEINELKKAEMEDLISAEPGRTEGQDLAAKIGAKEAEKERLLFGHFREIMALCRPEQAEKFRAVIGELLRMMGPPGQARGGDGPPGAKPPRRPGDKPPRKKGPDRPEDQPLPARR